jgi:hypothetical protein
MFRPTVFDSVSTVAACAMTVTCRRGRGIISKRVTAAWFRPS